MFQVSFNIEEGQLIELRSGELSLIVTRTEDGFVIRSSAARVTTRGEWGTYVTEFSVPVAMSLQRLAPILDKYTEELPLSIRPANALMNSEKACYVGQLVQFTEKDLLGMRNFGRRSLREVKRVLSDIGLSLGMDVGDWQPPDRRG